MFSSQRKYAKNIVNKFGMENSSHKRTPAPTHLKLTKDEKGVSVDQSLYRCLIGSLIYLTASRPDIAFAVGVCARYQADPKVRHANCCTLKFSLSFHQHFLNHKTHGTQDQTRVYLAQDTSLHCWPKLGFEFTQGCFDLQCPRWLSYFMWDSQGFPYQVSSLDPNQLDSWPRNQLYWGKSQLWPIDSKTSWNLTHINIMNSYEPFDQVWIIIPQEIWSDHQKGKMVIFRVLSVQR